MPRLHESLASKQNEIKSYFITKYNGNGILDMDELADCCKHVGLKFNQQEVITIWRKLDKKGKGKVAFKKLIGLISEETFASQR